MTPPKPPRKSYMMSTVTTSSDVSQSIYEDPDVSMLAITDGVTPMPRPRSKIKAECDSNDNTVDQMDNTTNAVTTQLKEYPSGHTQPVNPPPRLPVRKYVTSISSTAGVDGGNRYVNTRTQRPERPPPPSVYYDSSSSARPRFEIYTDGSQHSRPSSVASMRYTPVSPVLPDEALGPYGAYDSTARGCTDRPAVPPRPGQSSLPHSEYETPPPQIRPPLPPFNPPPPPSIGGQSGSTSSEMEFPPYLDILPDDDDDDRMTQRRSTLRFEEHYQRHCLSSQQSTEDPEDINGLLRWLKRASKDFMAPSLYGLSVEEEIRTFHQRAMNARKAVRLYNLLMMKRNETLRDLITEFSSISNSLDKMQKKTKTMGIAGGTTGAVGGVTAVLGIALAPMTMGTSLIATAVGAGMVASAGGMGAHSAKVNKKTVTKPTVEKLVCDYKTNVVDLENCLDFILSEMNELRRHDIPRLHRAGAQADALKMAHLSHSVIRNNMNNSGRSSMRLLQAFARELDQYFKDDGRKLRKKSKSKFSGRVRLLAENLQDELDHLNRIWEMFG